MLRGIGLALSLGLLLAGPARAYQVDRFTPQGEVARVSQAHARFSEDMVARIEGAESIVPKGGAPASPASTTAAN